MNDNEDDEKNRLFPASKRIKVQNTSSLVDLKAELFKRRQEAVSTQAADFTGRKGGSKWKEIAADLEAKGKDKELKRFLNRKEEEKSEVDEQLEKSLLLSRQALERKSKIYEERMQKAMKVIVESESEEDSDELVNFGEKALLENKMRILEKKNVKETQPKATVTCRSSIAIDDEDSEWTEFTDSLGRTRKCLKKDLDYYKSLDVKPIERGETPRDSVHFERSDAIEEKAEETAAANGPLHYQNVRNDEVRELGVGYFAFSSEEEERKNQMKMLNNLRNQTQKQRELRLKLKEKKNSQLEERLAKIAKRRGIEFKPKEEVEEKEVSTADIINRLISDAKHESVVIKKTEKVRDWDAGKVNDDGITLRSTTD